MFLVPAGMKRRRAALISVVIVVVVAGWVSYRLLAPPTRLAQGSPIQLDDFAFAVTDANPAGTSGGAELYAVKILVSNHALKVDYTFKPEEVEVEADGLHPLQYVSSSNWGPSTLKAGENRLFVLLFKGRPGAKALQVRFTFGGPLGTALESIFFGRKVLDVDVRQEG